MTRVRLVDSDTGGPIVRTVFGRIQGERGIVGNLLKVIAHNPTLLEPIIGFGEAARSDISLDRRTQELVVLLVAYLNRAPYEWAHHLRRAIDLGVTQAQVSALADWRKAENFSPRDRAALVVADEVTRTAQLSDNAFAEARGWFDERELVELVMTVSLYNMITRIGTAFDIDLEPIYGPADRLPE